MGAEREKGHGGKGSLSKLIRSRAILLLGNIDCSNSQWLFQHSLGKKGCYRFVSPIPFFISNTLQTVSLFPVSISVVGSCYSSIPPRRMSPVARAIFFSAALFIDSLPLAPPPPLVTGELILSRTQKTPVTDCHPPVRL